MVVVCAPRKLLKTSLDSSIVLSSNLNSNDLLVVPLVIDDVNTRGEILVKGDRAVVDEIFAERGVETDIKSTTHIGYPVELSKWNDAFQKELESALKQNTNSLEKGITIVIKKNGKVGSRRLGV